MTTSASSPDVSVPIRRLLFRGGSVSWIEAHLRSYAALGEAEGDSYPVEVEAADPSGWRAVRVGPALPTFHLYNLGVWMLGQLDEEGGPSALFIVEEGESRRWLRPSGKAGGESLLVGCDDDRKPVLYDLARAALHDDPRYRTTPMSTAMALLTAGVPPALHRAEPGRAIEATLTVTGWALGDGHPSLVARLSAWLAGVRG